MPGNRQTVLLFLAFFCFVAPVMTVVGMNWEQVRPYVVASPEDCEGRLLYFARPG